MNKVISSIAEAGAISANGSITFLATVTAAFTNGPGNYPNNAPRYSSD